MARNGNTLLLATRKLIRTLVKHLAGQPGAKPRDPSLNHVAALADNLERNETFSKTFCSAAI